MSLLYRTRHEALQNLALFVQRCQDEREDGGVAPNRYTSANSSLPTAPSAAASFSC